MNKWKILYPGVTPQLAKVGEDKIITTTIDLHPSWGDIIITIECKKINTWHDYSSNAVGGTTGVKRGSRGRW